MSEFVSNPEQVPVPIDRELVVGRLQEYGVGIEPEDLEGEDDEEVMAVIMSYVTMYDLDIDEIMRQVTPIEKRRKDEIGEPSEI